MPSLARELQPRRERLASPYSGGVDSILLPLVPWYLAHARDLPWRRAGFSPWGTLVSEFMLQQTQVSRVIPKLDEWLRRWPTPADLAAASGADVLRAWGNLGYPRRAMWLHAAARQITERHGGDVPADVDALLALSGIGDYTARAVAVFAYGMHEPVVDTNTRRVIARAVHGRSQPGQPARGDLDDMRALLPADAQTAAIVNAATMELGAVLCTSRAPRCESCPLSEACRWRAAGYPDTGDSRVKQARFAGSDRQARGAILRALRESEHPLPAFAVVSDWPDAAQRERAITSLLADGLVERNGEGLQLVGSTP